MEHKTTVILFDEYQSKLFDSNSHNEYRFRIVQKELILPILLIQEVPLRQRLIRLADVLEIDYLMVDLGFEYGLSTAESIYFVLTLITIAKEEGIKVIPYIKFGTLSSSTLSFAKILIKEITKRDLLIFEIPIENLNPFVKAIEDVSYEDIGE
ncbi:MAG TPA: hypothetical protein VLB02_00315 [Candidatus Paceibacterota bacterium]|nr:hypothetical protein [Candidatus Paceibacterota bacterium]